MKRAMINVITTLAIGAVATTSFVAPALAATTFGTSTKEGTSKAMIKAVAGGDTSVDPVEPTRS